MSSSPVEGFGVVEAVVPGEGSLVLSAQLGVVPVDLLLMAMEGGRPLGDVEAAAAAVGGEVVGRLEVVDFYQVRFPGGSEADLLAALEVVRSQPGVVWAVEQAALFLDGDTCESRSALGESSYSEGTNARPLEMIGVEEAWGIIRASGVGLRGARVGVIDDQLPSWSSEIGGENPIRGLTAADTTDDVAQTDGSLEDGGLTHGGMVAQVIGADAANGGVAGAAALPGAGVEVRVSDIYTGPRVVEVPGTLSEEDQELLELAQHDGTAFTYNDMEAILDQVREGATVINMSYGAYPSAPGNAQAEYYRLFLERMYARFPGVVFVASAGNRGVGLDGTNKTPGGIPAPNLITVGGLTQQGDRAEFSNFAAEGGEVTLAAPGEGIPVGVGQDGRTVTADGTSLAAPQVASAAALMKSINPELDAAEIKRILVETAYSGAPAAEGADQSLLVPENLGGRILRVDEAVLRVINDLRRQADPDAEDLDKDHLLGLARIRGEAAVTGPYDYDAVATIDAARPDGSTVVTIQLLGEGQIEGSSTDIMTDPGHITWPVSTLPGKELPGVRICRTDITACCDLTPQPATLDGHYQGTWTWVGQDLSDLPEFLSGGDMSGGFDHPSDLQMDITTSPDGSGTVNVTYTGILPSWASTGTATGPLLWTPGEVQFTVGLHEFTGAISWSGAAVALTGTCSIPVLEWQGAFYGTVFCTWQVTKTG